MTEKIEEALNVIKQAMIDDNPSELGSYAHSWHCNIAMMCYDAIRAHEVEAFYEDSGSMSHNDALNVGNDAASRFMKICFDVETNNGPE